MFLCRVLLANRLRCQDPAIVDSELVVLTFERFIRGGSRRRQRWKLNYRILIRFKKRATLLETVSVAAFVVSSILISSVWFGLTLCTVITEHFLQQSQLGDPRKHRTI
jgi:hypothetical protein